MTAAVSLRFFVITHDGSLNALSMKSLDAITSMVRPIKLPAFAGREVRIAQVRIDMASREAPRILSVLWSTLPIDVRGVFDQETALVRAGEGFRSAVFEGRKAKPKRTQRVKRWAPSVAQKAQLRSAALARCRLPYFKV